MPKKVTKEDMKNAAPFTGADICIQKELTGEYLISTAKLIFDRLRKECEKKKISLKTLLLVSKEARPWFEMLINLLGLMPSEKAEIDINLLHIKVMDMTAQILQTREKERKKLEKT
ncbi:MAG: hypothetical protein KAV87_01935 [Desulfobacteraceae bacterium]|nr:hypothetical protein [Desulfobacteraceae bacterium]